MTIQDFLDRHGGCGYEPGTYSDQERQIHKDGLWGNYRFVAKVGAPDFGPDALTHGKYGFTPPSLFNLLDGWSCFYEAGGFAKNYIAQRNMPRWRWPVPPVLWD